MSESADSWVKIGIVGRPHGLGGAFFVSRRKDSIPKSYKEVRIGDRADQADTFKVKTSRMQAGRPLLHLESHRRREAVEPLVGSSIWVARHIMEIDTTSEYAWHDLIDLKVTDNAGTILGKIINVANFGASDIITIVDDAGRSLDIPIVGNYVLVEEISKGENVKLAVSKDVFDSLWTDARK